jgi:hypothetical protein
VSEKKPSTHTPGITWDSRKKRWHAQIFILGRTYHISYSAIHDNAIADRAKVLREKAAIVRDASLIKDEDERQRYVATRIGDLVGREPKSSKHKGVSLHERDGKWRAQLRINKIKYHIGSYDDEDTAGADVAKMLEHVDELSEELAKVEEGERARHWTRRMGEILGYALEKQGSQYKGVMKNGNGFKAFIHLNGTKYYRPTLTGPNAEEQAAREHEVIYAKRDLVKEQLQGMADRDEKKWYVQEYWAGLLGEEPPPRRISAKRDPAPLRPRPKAEGAVRTLWEPKLQVKAKVQRSREGKEE